MPAKNVSILSVPAGRKPAGFFMAFASRFLDKAFMLTSWQLRLKKVNQSEREQLARLAIFGE